MLSAQQRWRTQRNLMLLGLCLGVYYLAVYRPLARHAAEMDRPLTNTWRRLIELSPFAGSLDADYGARVKAGLEQARDSVSALERLHGELAARLEPDPALRERMGRPFQLIEFQNERQVRLEEVARLATQNKVGLGAEVAAGFPEYTAGRRNPTLLWPQLGFAHHLLAGALQCKVSTVAVVRLPPMEFHPAGTNLTMTLVEIPLQVELGGPAPAVAQFLETLPLRAEEIKARGLPEPLTNKPVMFIRGLVLRKAGRQTLDQVWLELTSSAFVPIARAAEPEPSG